MLRSAAMLVLLSLTLKSTSFAQSVGSVTDLVIIANQGSTSYSGTTGDGIRLGRASGESGTMTGGQYIHPGPASLSANADSRPFGGFGGVNEFARYRVNVTFPVRPVEELIVPHPNMEGEEIANGTLIAPASYFVSYNDFENGISFASSLEDEPWQVGIAEVDYMWYTSEVFRNAGAANGLYWVNQVTIRSVPEPSLPAPAIFGVFWLLMVANRTRRIDADSAGCHHTDA